MPTPKGASAQTTEARPLFEIASEIADNWRKPSPHATPYINAMMSLNKLTDHYGAENARSIVSYFLGNAGTWRGELAQQIKFELREMLAKTRS